MRTIEKCPFVVIPQYRDGSGDKINLGTMAAAGNGTNNGSTYLVAGDTYDDVGMTERTADGPTDEMQTDDYIEVANETKWTNLVVNPEFGTNTTGWSDGGQSSTLERVSLVDEGLPTEGLPPGVTHALKITAAGGDEIMSQFGITLTAAEHYCSAYAFIPEVNGFDGTALRLTDNGAFGGATGTSFADYSGTAGVWERANYDISPVGGDLDGLIRLKDNAADTTAGTVVYITAAQACLGDNPYRSGSHPLGRWTGTAHASTSESRSNLDLLIDSSCMALFAGRTYGLQPAANEQLIGKKDGGGVAVGWQLINLAASDDGQFKVADDTFNPLDKFPTDFVSGAIFVVAGRRDVSADEIEAFKDGAASGSPAEDTNVGTIENALPTRIGADSGGTPALYAAAEHFGSAFWNTHDNSAPTDLEVKMASHQLAAMTGRFV